MKYWFFLAYRSQPETTRAKRSYQSQPEPTVSVQSKGWLWLALVGPLGSGCLPYYLDFYHVSHSTQYIWQLVVLLIEFEKGSGRLH